MNVPPRRAAALVTAVAIVLLFAPMLVRDGPLLWVDAPMWATAAAELKAHVLPEQRWLWSIQIPQINAGEEFGQLYSLNLLVLWALVHVATPAFAVKLACLLSALVFGLGVQRIGSRLGSPWIAAVAAVLGTIGVTTPVLSGLWYEVLSVGLALWGWDALVQHLRHGRSRDWIVSTALFAATVYTHPLGALTLGAVWAGLVAERFSRRAPFRRGDLALLAMPVVGVLLATPQVLALLVAGPTLTRTSVAGHDTVLAFSRLLCLYLLVPAVQAALMAAAGLGLWRSGTLERRWRWTVVAVLVAAAAVILEVPRLLPTGFPFRQGLVMFPARFVHVLQVVYLLLFVVGVDALLRWSRGQRRTVATLGLALLATAVVAEVGHYAFLRAARRQVTLGSVENEPELRRLWSWIDANVDAPEARIYVEDTVGTYPLRPAGRPVYGEAQSERGHVLALTGLFTDVRQINGWAVFATEFGARHCNDGGRLLGLAADDLDESLRRLNCRYVIVHSDAVKARVATVPSLRRIESIGVFDVYEHTGLRPGWAFRADDLDARLAVDTDEAGFRHVVHAVGAEGGRIVASVAYHRNWHAYVDGSQIPVASTSALVAFDLPRAGPCDVELRFEPERTAPLLGLSAGVLLLLLGGVLLRRGVSAVPEPQ